MVLGLLALAESISVQPSQGGPIVGGPTVPTKHHGIAFEHAWGRRAASRGYGTIASGDSLSRLQTLGVNWISVVPFGFQRTPSDTAIRWGDARFSETDERLRAVAVQAHERDISVMLKPHVWLRPPRVGWDGGTQDGGRLGRVVRVVTGVLFSTTRPWPGTQGSKRSASATS